MTDDLRRLAAALPYRFDHAQLLDAMFRVKANHQTHTLPLVFVLGSDTVGVGSQLVDAGLATFSDSTDGVWSWTKSAVGFADDQRPDARRTQRLNDLEDVLEWHLSDGDLERVLEFADKAFPAGTRAVEFADRPASGGTRRADPLAEFSSIMARYVAGYDPFEFADADAPAQAAGQISAVDLFGSTSSAELASLREAANRA